MNILLTGGNGFLGFYIKQAFGKETLTTLGLSDCDINLNLAKSVPKLNNAFDIVIHAAGKAHFNPVTEKDKQSFFEINFRGTKNLCSALEKCIVPKSLIFISSVAVYGIESGLNINEDNPLNGYSPYALSKIQAELFLTKWCDLNNVKLGILRPSLIAGRNPPGNLKAMINGINTGRYFRIGKGSARKSILMAEDIAYLIPKLAEVGGIYNVCDSHHPSIAELEKTIARQLNKRIPKSIPLWIAKSLGLIGDLIGDKFPFNTDRLQKIVQPLTFSNEKAKRVLDWEPTDVLENFRIY